MAPCAQALPLALASGLLWREASDRGIAEMTSGAKTVTCDSIPTPRRHGMDQNSRGTSPKPSFCQRTTDR